MFEGEVESVKWNHFNPYLFIAATDAGTVHGIDVRYAMRTLVKVELKILQLFSSTGCNFSYPTEVVGCRKRQHSASCLNFV